MATTLNSIPFGQDTLLLFDGECRFCRRCVEALHRIDRHGRVRAVSAQDAVVRNALGLAAEEAAHSVWLYIRMPSGRWLRCAGAAAVSSALDIALGGRVFRTIYHLPTASRLEERLYRLVADNRVDSCHSDAEHGGCSAVR